MSGSFEASLSLSPQQFSPAGPQASVPINPHQFSQGSQTPPSKPTAVTPPPETPPPPLDLPPTVKWQATGEMSDGDEEVFRARPSALLAETGALPETNIFAPENGWLEGFFVCFWGVKRPLFRGELLVLGNAFDSGKVQRLDLDIEG